MTERGSFERLFPGVYVWFAAGRGHGHPNAAAVVDDDGITVVDTLMVRSQSEPFAAAVEALDLPVRRAVVTSSHIEFTGGTHQFRRAAIYGSAQASAHLDQPVDVDACRCLYPEWAAEFDDEMATRPVSHVVDGPVQLTPALAVLPTTGQTAENLVVVLPGVELLLAGAMCSFGVTPLCFQGDPAAWADALDGLTDLAPIVVPGHGPVGGAEEICDLQGYLRACVDADGDPDRIPEGPWDDWPGREHDAVNVERAALLARGDDTIPEALLRRLGRT